MHRIRVIAIIIVAAMIGFYMRSEQVDAAGKPSGGLYPDLRTVVPQHVEIMNQQQHSYLRFSNGVANTGDGPLRLRPENHITDTSAVTNGIQEILDANGNKVYEQVVSQFAFHPAHNHWHIADVALFSVHAGSPTGPIVGSTSTKITSCLIDWYKLDDNAPRPERTYWDCYTSYQGISVGWVDQYHMSLEGQELDITAIPSGRYYFVSTANPLNHFLEKDYTNNTAWVGFDLVNDNKGNAKLTIVDHSPCSTPGLCGDTAPNR